MFLFRKFLITAFTVFLPVNFVFSQTIIEDFDIPAFNGNAGVIDLPNLENKGKVAVGQPTLGQSKEELAEQLELNGEFVAILEANNQLAVESSAEEAERWRQEERVKTVGQGSLGVSADITRRQSDYPVYRDDMLIIPRVDTDEQTGLFQDGVFQYDPTVSAWRLIAFDTYPIPRKDGIGGKRLAVEKVEKIITDTSPVQVFLKITGYFSDGCGGLKQINQRLNGNSFEITLHGKRPPPGIVCMLAIVSFEKIIPLEVYGLPAGTYEYSVNRELFGTFDLTADNEL